MKTIILLLTCIGILSSFTVQAEIRHVSLKTVKDANYRMHTGEVKWFDRKSGFGFIAPRDGSEDVFVHFSTIVPNNHHKTKTLKRGQAVDFAAINGAKGRQTIWVYPK